MSAQEGRDGATHRPDCLVCGTRLREDEWLWCDACDARAAQGRTPEQRAATERTTFAVWAALAALALGLWVAAWAGCLDPARAAPAPRAEVGR